MPVNVEIAAETINGQELTKEESNAMVALDKALTLSARREDAKGLDYSKNDLEEINTALSSYKSKTLKNLQKITVTYEGGKTDVGVKDYKIDNGEATPLGVIQGETTETGTENVGDPEKVKKMQIADNVRSFLKDIDDNIDKKDYFTANPGDMSKIISRLERDDDMKLISDLDENGGRSFVFQKEVGVKQYEQIVISILNNQVEANMNEVNRNESVTTTKSSRLSLKHDEYGSLVDRYNKVSK